MTFDEYQAREARLIILRELAGRDSGEVHSTWLGLVLDGYGHRRTPDWLETQLNALVELGAVRLTPAGTIHLVKLLSAGLEHLERRRFLAGVMRPSQVED